MEIEGVAATEYDIATSEGPQSVTRWIASDLGKVAPITTSLSVFLNTASPDDDAFLEFSSHEQLGVIDIVICAIEAAVRNVSSVPSAPSTNRDFLPELKVHERSKKAVTQQAGEVLTNPKPRLNVKCGPDLVTFSFKYRPLDLLQANGIAPPPPRLKRKASPLPERAPTPEEDPVDEEELRVLREKLNALEARRARNDVKVVQYSA
ncbi:hypothetical protein B0H11DRAFT_2201587, partial [Mycena galericulata]